MDKVQSARSKKSANGNSSRLFLRSILAYLRRIPKEDAEFERDLERVQRRMSDGARRTSPGSRL
jgi:hypothetical protein